MHKPQRIVSLLLLFLLVIAVPVTVFLTQQQQEIRSKAALLVSPITVDLSSNKPLPRIWNNLSQGGEIPLPQLPGARIPLGELAPQYIRLDHIFDSYEVVKRDSMGNLAYNFLLLDQEVDAIRAAGATPYLSLSYIPPDIADVGNNQRPNYVLWQQVVQAVVGHYSGKVGKNIINVYYEVYNEPDLFGKWSGVEYSQLYEASVAGAASARNTNQYFIGGPALSYLDQSFTNSFLDTVVQKNLRFDFFSWHLYSPNVTRVSKEAILVRGMLRKYPQLANTPLVLSEWGSFSEKHSWHDSLLDSSHMVAFISQALPYISQMDYFELKDGANSGNGGWGILTNEAAGLRKKPRFYTITLLNKVKPLQFPATTSLDSPIYTIATGNNRSDVAILLTNYTYGKKRQAVTVPLHFDHLLAGVYTVQKTIQDNAQVPYQEDRQTFSFGQTVDIPLELNPDSVVLVEMKRVSAAQGTTTGISGDPNDHAAAISDAQPTIDYDLTPNDNAHTTQIQFSMQLQAALSRLPESVIFTSKDASANTLLLRVVPVGFANQLEFISNINGQETVLKTIPIASDVPNQWHTFQILINAITQNIQLTIDGVTTQGTFQQRIKLGETISFGDAAKPLPGAIDAIHITQDGKELLGDSF